MRSLIIAIAVFVTGCASPPAWLTPVATIAQVPVCREELARAVPAAELFTVARDLALLDTTRARAEQIIDGNPDVTLDTAVEYAIGGTQKADALEAAFQAIVAVSKPYATPLLTKCYTDITRDWTAGREALEGSGLMPAREWVELISVIALQYVKSRASQ